MNNITIPTFEFMPSSIDEKRESLESLLFNIPIYQRLYAWEEAEIKQLLEDLHRQFEKEKSKEKEAQKPYYLGNLVLYKNENERYDVIDGQQRLTTLFLIGLVFKESYKDKDWSKFLQKGEKETRLAFIAREDDNIFLEAKLKGEEAKTSEKLNVMMANALRIIGEFQHSEDTGFQQYVYEKTTMVGIIIPEGIDLNKYFEDMNNRGVQLEKHEILKAKLISNIDKNEQSFYARLWDACSQMNQYVEYGFDKTLQETREHILSGDFTKLNKNKQEDNGKDGNEAENKYQLSNILNQDYSNKNDNNTDFEKPEKVGSIINFPTFILHCLKLFIADKEELKDYDVKLSDKDLLDVFSENTIQTIDAKGFIYSLFTCRVLYDAFFIKSIEDKDGNNVWKIRKIEDTQNADEKFARKSHLDETTVIQAMLNASTSLDNWFTPALKYVKKYEKSLTDEIFCKFLENLDTDLAKKRIGSEDYETWFSKNLHNGTGTPRYWFFRLDYYLRKEWIKKGAEPPKMVDIWKIKNYQFRQNRSVEHIQAQSKKEGWETTDLNVDNFGNLALISVSSNSSYNNQGFAEKKLDFIKRTKNWGIESLKQLAIFEHEKWTAKEAQDHGEKMINILIQSLQ